MRELSEEEIYTQLREILAVCLPELPAEKITMDSVINRDLGVDSMNFVMIVCKVEAAFDIRIPDAVWPRLQTVRDVTTEIEKLVCERSDADAAEADPLKVAGEPRPAETTEQTQAAPDNGGQETF